MGIGDDCALIRPSAGEDIAVTTDFSLENVHFRRDWHPPESVGHRCLARGLSDLAAMGARPLAAFLSLAVPVELTAARRGTRSWVERFFDGLLALADRMHVPLAGGDIAQSPPSPGDAGRVAADIVLLGAVRRGKALLRSGARAGDRLYVTSAHNGGLGGAAAELLALEHAPKKFARLTATAPGHPHFYPEPRVQTGRRLTAQKLASSAIDLSDGLSIDLARLCEESGLAAVVNASAIPKHPMASLAEAAGWAPSAEDLALHGGEDYELLITARPTVRLPRSLGGVTIYPIGQMHARTNGPALTLVGDEGILRKLEPAGWQHFRRAKIGRNGKPRRPARPLVATTGT